MCRVILCGTEVCLPCLLLCGFFFFFNDTATTEIYTLSLHDALPILSSYCPSLERPREGYCPITVILTHRSEEHTSELQSRLHLVCRLLLEKNYTDRLRVQIQKPDYAPAELFLHTRAPRSSALPIHACSRPRTPSPSPPSFFFFFFKGWGPPRFLPFSPTPPSPD